MSYKNKITNNHPGYAISSRNTDYSDNGGSNEFQNSLSTSLPNRTGGSNQATTFDGKTYSPLVIPLQFYILAGGIPSTGTIDRYFTILENNDNLSYPDKFPAYTSYFIKGLACTTNVWNLLEGSGFMGVKGNGNTSSNLGIQGFYNYSSLEITTGYNNNGASPIINLSNNNNYISYNANCSKLFIRLRFNPQPSDAQKDVFINFKITLI
mgnify:CR=1 FL=1